jgi:AsmA protein
MKKFIKITSITFAIILLILVISPFIVAIIIDPNDYKDDISKLVLDKTGRTLTIKGDLNYSVFPWLGVSLGELQLSNSTAKGFSKADFAKIKSADVRIKIMPLLSSKVEIDKIVLAGLNLTLEKNKQGVTNWQDLIKKSKAKNQSQTNTQKPPADDSKNNTNVNTDATTILPAIAGIELIDANINWHDKQLNQQYELHNLNFSTGAIADNTPTDINIDLSFKSNKPEISGSTTLSATVKFDINNQIIVIKNIALTQKLNQKFQKPNDIILTLNADTITANIKKETASITNLKLASVGLEITSSLKATKIISDVNVTGTIATNEFNPTNILKTLQISLPKMADKTVLKKTKLKINLTANTHKIAIQALSLAFDDTEVKGKLSIANFSKPQIRYKLNINEINVDRYLPPPPTKTTSHATSKTTAAKPAPASRNSAQSNTPATDIALPLDLLRSLDVKGTITLGKTVVSKLHSRDIKLSVLAKNGVIRVNPISAKMYQGQYSGDITLNAQKQVPVITMNESIRNVAFQPLVIDYLGKDYLSGFGTAKAKLTTKGLNVSQFTKNLNGTVSFNIKDSKIKYLNVKYRINKEVYKFIKKPYKEEERYDNPNVFKIMKGSFQVKNGIAHNRDFITESRDVNLNGKGYIDLVSNKINYNANIIIQRDITTGSKTIDKELKLLTKRPIPTPITGPFTNISVKPKIVKTLQKAHEEKLKKKLNTKIDREKEKLKEKEKEEERKLKEKLKKKLKNLFK